MGGGKYEGKHQKRVALAFAKCLGDVGSSWRRIVSYALGWLHGLWLHRLEGVKGNRAQGRLLQSPQSFIPLAALLALFLAPNLAYASYGYMGGCKYGQASGYPARFRQVRSISTYAGRHRKLSFKGLCAYRALVWFLVAVFALIPRFAFATVVGPDQTGIVWGPTIVLHNVATDKTERGVVTIAANSLNAALITLGYSVTDSRLTSVAKAKLSNDVTGGAFFTFSRRFDRLAELKDDNYPNYPSWGGMSSDMFDFWGLQYGRNNVWFASYTDKQFASAKEDLEAVLNGGDLGGDSGGNLLNGYHYLGTTNTLIYASSSAAVFRDCHIVDGDIVTTGSTRSVYPSDVNESFYVDYAAYDRVSAYSNVLLVSFTAGVDISATNGSISSSVHGSGDTLRLRFNFSKSGIGMSSWSSHRYYDLDSGVYFCTVSSINFKSVSQTQYSNGRYYTGPIADEPVIPPTQWPEDEEPVAPSPPELPNPSNPTVDPPTDPTPPTNPTPPTDPTPPEDPVLPPTDPYPTPTIDPGPTYTTADLSAVLDAMDQHCRHIQTAIYTSSSNLWSLLSARMGTLHTQLISYLGDNFTDVVSAIRAQGGYIVDVLDGDLDYLASVLKSQATGTRNLISAEFASTRDYLYQLFHWLAGQFDFSITGSSYNDDTVVSWLMRIYSKLGSGIRSRPADPVSDPVGTGDWFGALISNLLADLLALGTGELAQLTSSVEALTQKFPFSVPWDIAALLGLLVADPVAPSFSVPAFSVTASGLAQVGSYDISLADYDAAWEGVRFVEKVGFAVFLAMNTGNFRSMLKKE